MRLLLLIFAVVLAWSPAVTAQELDPSSLTAEQRRDLGELFTEARDAFDAGQFAVAIGALQKAHAIFPEPNILYRIGDAYERDGNLERAIEYYSRYVEQSKDEDTGLVAKRIEDLRLRVDGQRVEDVKPVARGAVLILDSTPTGATVYINDTGQVAGETPLRVSVPAGPCRVRFVADGYHTSERVLELQDNETHSIAIGLKAVETKVEEPAPSMVGPAITGAFGIGLGVTAAVLGGLSLNAKSKLDGYRDDRDRARSAGEPIPARPADWDTLERQQVTFGRSALVTGSAALVAVAAALVWWVVRTPDEVGSDVAVGTSGRSVVVRFRW